MRVARTCGVAGLLFVLGSGDSEAGGGRGVVVRLELGGDAPSATPAVRLTNSFGKVDVALSDRGESPDVEAGDGIWSGATLMAGDDAVPVLTIGDKVLTGEKVVWEAANFQRDVTFHLDGDVLTGVTNTASSVDAATPSTAAGSPATGAVTDPATGEVTAPSAAAPSGSSDWFSKVWSSASGSGSKVYFGLAAGILALAALGWYTMRGDRDDGGELPPPLPEPPILGKGTPSLSDGLALWVCPADDCAALAELLMGTLGRHHRVLVVCAEDLALAPVFGGPMYRAPSVEPEDVGQAAEDLMNESGAPVALFVQLTATAAHAMIEELPEGLGGIVLVADAEGVLLPTVQCARQGENWTFASANGTATARATWSGLEPTGSGA